ncbi:hypothetical protein [Streptomyces mirabilis]|uniref:hypothetical protein n=1 Tax=Streptomyces mirabilis TaxID=68239 RepID=UPI00224E8CA9|nr:hypothetical protein [Streptomyces mirabilis]MCX4430280.1 hypothetical protein [Streptomyces mirabilis]
MRPPKPVPRTPWPGSPKWQGDEQGAARMYRLAVDAGHLGALGGLARIRNESPDAHMRLGLETDGSLADPWTWQDPDSPPAGHTPGPA